MALSRKFLSALGIEADKIDEIIEAHAATVNALKEERDNFKADAERYKDTKKELDRVSNELETIKAEGGKEDSYKVKYDALKEEFDSFKKEQSEKELRVKKEQAYKVLLQEAGVSEKRVDAVLKVSDIDSLEFNEDGSIKDADNLKKGIETEWEDFIVRKETQGTQTPTPPQGSGKVYKTKEEIMSIKDTRERQQAISENHELFGF